MFIPTQASDERIKHFQTHDKNKNHFYFLPNFKVHEILTHDFVDKYIKKGNICLFNQKRCN